MSCMRVLAPLRLLTKICDIGIRFRQSPSLYASQLPKKQSAENGISWVVLNLCFEESHCTLRSGTETEIATLNVKSFDQLRDMQKSKGLLMEGLMSLEALANLTSSNGVITPGKVWTIDLNIYGKPAISDEVAREIAHHKLFLQYPDFITPGTSYENPQYLKLPPQVLPGISGVLAPGADKNDLSAQETLSMVPGDQDAFGVHESSEIDFNEVLDQFAWHHQLAQATVDSRIRTILLESVRSVEAPTICC